MGDPAFNTAPFDGIQPAICGKTGDLSICIYHHMFDISLIVFVVPHNQGEPSFSEFLAGP